MSFLNKIIKTQFINNATIMGLPNSLFSVYINNLCIQEKRSILVVVDTLFEATRLVEALNNLNNDALLFPMDDFLVSEALAVSPDLKVSRIETLKELLSHQNKIVVTHLMGYLRFLPSVKTFKSSVITLKKDTDINIKNLSLKLQLLGYNKETLVTRTGEYGQRGYVIDIFPISENHPVRIELFGDTIESIRYFDEESQQSIKEINEISIYPFTEFLTNKEVNLDNKQRYLKKYEEVVNVAAYLENPITLFKDIKEISKNYQTLQKEILDYNEKEQYDDVYMLEFNEITPLNKMYFDAINNYEQDHNFIKYEYAEVPIFYENIEAINKYLRENVKNKTIIICLKDYQIKNFVKTLAINYFITDEENIKEKAINIVPLNLENGFIINDYIVISATNLFNIKESNYRYKTKFKYASKIKDINKLAIGDYVVHNIHGIGIYNGIKTLPMDDILKDYIEILYLDKDKLYIPVEKINNISKYTGKEGVSPKIHKLDGLEWEKLKTRVRNKVKDIAEDLIKLYAKRQMQKGYMFSMDSILQEEFEKDFIYQETPDQLLTTKQIKDDMESSYPMDRLLCGDVGYGKTEVAFRAIFKAISDSKQVLYLCPTTILSSQQYKSAIERFKNYPVNIALLNRFVSKKEQSKIAKDLEMGQVDLLIGTHRLLSDDIRPKDLGLIIVDEEQRFGVTHKEKLKNFKANVDVLTLTATPIPRTLQMSITGIRSLSLIETPPINRYPIQTYVTAENTVIIKDAISKELARHGQVFLLYNRVETIETKTDEIRRLVPSARVIYAHGRMTKNELEKRMLKFINKEFDILVCTTIIETGIDIPNANTLIILDADRFGLSQLYQIRGRVGRSDKIAYAYLMYNPLKTLTTTAIKRLEVIKEFTELGSGFSIANRDLNIRGAGDILGSEQAGFIDSVGIELYLKILNEEVNKLKGLEVTDEELTNKAILNVDTHIEDKYVSDNDLKIEIHKKINMIDSYDKLLCIKTEIEDRFGKINEKILIYMYEEWFEKMAKKLNVEEVKQTKNNIIITFNKEASKLLNGEKLFLQAYKISDQINFVFKNEKIIINLNLIKLDKHFIYILCDLFDEILKNCRLEAK
ncbi:MAG: transcription-repair coupling factor [Bacilli bacterium]